MNPEKLHRPYRAPENSTRTLTVLDAVAAVSRQNNGPPTADGTPATTPRDDLVWYSGATTPEVPKLEWIAHPFVLRGGSATHFIGRPKVAKTTYLLALAEAVTKGRDFLGH